MAQHIVVKKKDHIATLLAAKVNLKRAKMIVGQQRDKYATYLIAEVVETISPSINNKVEENEDRESIQENAHRKSFLRNLFART